MNGDYEEHTMTTHALYNRGPHIRPQGKNIEEQNKLTL